jgi:hypothetical protein
LFGAQLGKTKNDASHANFSGNRVLSGDSREV